MYPLCVYVSVGKSTPFGEKVYCGSLFLLCGGNSYFICRTNLLATVSNPNLIFLISHGQATESSDEPLRRIPCLVLLLLLHEKRKADLSVSTETCCSVLNPGGR